MRVRVFAALAAALLLLSSGLGSGAKWYDEAAFSQAPITVETGELAATAADPAYRVMSRIDKDARLSGKPSCTATGDFRSCAVLTKDQAEAFAFMRGDRLIVSSSFEVAADGENLRYAVTPDAAPANVSAAWSAGTAAVSPTGPLTGSQTVTAERPFDCLGAAAGSSDSTALTIPSLSVTVVQEDR